MTIAIDIKRAVTNGGFCHFAYYRDGQLWYRTAFDELFPVPIAEIGTASFLAVEKAILLMRYMRKYNDVVQHANT